ncbi:hypothetical protein QAD02_021012 [Eretmocerus hayati]|uniref:Uncharacterized protein n=1 Tax=Eretmocerus hayati TaxID=131215 RepID=A0ACC2PRJ6_9HYME|nr:hypothetical protein QAD02_021012 [Eretmocerus hayati]
MPLQELLRRIEDLETGLQSVNVNIHILSGEAASTGRLISEQFALNSSTQNIIFYQSQISLRVQEDDTKAVERLKALLNSQNQQIETLSKRLRETENLLFSTLFKASQTSENQLTDALLFLRKLKTRQHLFKMESVSTPSVGDVSSGTSNSYTDRIEVHEINEIPGDILIMNVDRMPDLRLPSTNRESNPPNRACESNGGAPQLGNPDRSMQGSSAVEPGGRQNPKRVTDVARILPDFDGQNITVDQFIRECKNAERFVGSEDRDFFLELVKAKVVGPARAHIQGKIQVDLACVYQKPNEEVADYGLRVSNLLQRGLETTQSNFDSTAAVGMMEGMNKTACECFILGLCPEISSIMLGHSPATLQIAISTAVEFEKRINQRRELHAESEGPNRVRKVFCNAIDTQETGRDQLSAVNERSAEELNETIPFFNHVSVHLPPRTEKLCYLRVKNSNQQSGYVARLETGPGIFAGECLVTNRNGMASLFIINTTGKEGEEDQRETKRIKTFQQDEPTNETHVILCVSPKTPGCTPAGEVLPEDSQGPATSGTTPTARSSKRARENLIGAPAQSQKGKTFHSYVDEIGIDIGSPAKKFKLSDWGGRNNGRNDDVHIQETSDAVEHIETVGRRDEKIDGIELVGGEENIGPVEEILEDIMPVEGVIGNIGPVGEISEDIMPVERIAGNIGPIEGGIIRPVERTGEDTIEEIGNIGPVGGSVKDIAEIGHVVDEIEVEPVKYVDRIEGYKIEKPHTSLLTEEESGKHHTSLLTEEESGKHHTSLLTEEESGKPHTSLLTEEESGEPHTSLFTEESGEHHTSLLTEEESGKHHTSLLTEEESGKPHTSLLTEEDSGEPHTSPLTEEESGKTHTSLLTEEESGTFRDIDNIDYKLGHSEISPLVLRHGIYFRSR